MYKQLTEGIWSSELVKCEKHEERVFVTKLRIEKELHS